MKKGVSIWIVLSLTLVITIIFKSCKSTNDWGTDIVLMVRIDSITMTSAVLMGDNYHVSSSINHGFYWSSTSANPSEKDNKIELGQGNEPVFKFRLSGLNPDTKYYVKAYLERTSDKGESVTAEFTTLPEIPIIVTSFVHEFTRTSAVFGGQIAFQGLTPLTDQGVYWGLSPNPETTGAKLQMENVDGAFSSIVTGLSPGTDYYVKAYGTNIHGTSLGLEYSFNTGQNDFKPTVTDIDSNVYHYVKIGQQIWMAENLKVIHLSDSSAITLVTDNKEWSSTSSPAYCWYNNDASTYKKDYGALYNWHAVNTGKLCPKGWHIPSQEEWEEMSNYLGGELYSGGKLKEAGTIHWTSPDGTITNKSNIGSTNETGFTALPGGSLLYYGGAAGFGAIGSYGYWWSSTKADYSENAFVVALWYDDLRWHMAGNTSLKNGFSVRCLKDE